VVIQPLSTRLIQPNFCFDLSHRRSTTVSLETRNSLVLIITHAVVCITFRLRLHDFGLIQGKAATFEFGLDSMDG